jgi:phospholipase C
MKSGYVQTVRRAAGTCAALGLAIFASRPPRVLAQGCTLPPSPGDFIQHIVVIVLEDRSFDHLVGWYTSTQSQTYSVNGPQSGEVCSTFPLNRSNDPDCALGWSRNGNLLTVPTSTGTDDSDPDHALNQLARFYDRDGQGNGNADGWLFSLAGDPLNTSHYTIGYYEDDAQMLPYLTRLLRDSNSITLTNYFASMIAQTRPNRMYEHAATTDRIDNGDCQFGCPPGQNTIWDLDLGGLGTAFPDVPGHLGRYYYGGSNVSAPRDYLSLLWPDRNYVTHPVAGFMDDLHAGTLAPVTFIDSQHYHPPEDISSADLWLEQIVEAIRQSSFWSSTVIVVTFDEGGGFFDHVVPPMVPSVTYADVIAGQQGGMGPDANGLVPLGFRVPAVIVSPFGPSTSGPSLQYDHTSVLKMIEWAFLNNWRIPPGTHRDATDDAYIANLACAMNFTKTSVPKNASAHGR